MRTEEASVRTVGRYAIHDELAAGGMGRVFLGQLIGPVGFSRIVAIKELHPKLAEKAELVEMFLDEARMSARIHHPNVVQTLDVIAEPGVLLLVMEYVKGESLHRLLRTLGGMEERMPPLIAVAILVGVLQGLHAAHEATGESGQPLGIIHRDVSPPNVLVGVDGVARLLDFGVAKAAERLHMTVDGTLKGKLTYMAPELLEGAEASRLSDVYAASVVLWETLTSRRLFADDQNITRAVLNARIPSPREIDPTIPPLLDQIVMCGLARKADARFPDAQSMAEALENAVRPATNAQVGVWVAQIAAGALAQRASRIREIESRRAPNPRDLRAALAEMAVGTEPLSSSSPDVHTPPGASEDVTAQCLAKVGMTLSGKWHLERLVGVGGMASVYAARHRNGAQRAIKLLHPEYSLIPDLRGRFLREAYITNRVAHAGVVPVLDDGVDDSGTPFLVMELLLGQTLAQRAVLLEGRLPRDAVILLAKATLSILEAAHAQGIVHRDVKPDNLFWTASRELKLLDFGIARVREHARMTRSGLPLGTPGFMAPEQARDRADEIDGRTDLWAVGATMFTLLTGNSVHAGESESDRILEAATRPVRSLGHDMPNLNPALISLVDCALSFDPRQRFADASAMREAIDLLIEDLLQRRSQ